jgi:hypothetical protein
MIVAVYPSFDMSDDEGTTGRVEEKDDNWNPKGTKKKSCINNTCT